VSRRTQVPHTADRPVPRTGLSPSSVTLPSSVPLPDGFLQLRGPLCTSPHVDLQPRRRNGAHLARHRFGLFPLRSPLLRESLLISFPPGTEMVQFPGYRFHDLSIQSWTTGIEPAGLPHSAIRGSQDVCSSPRLFAAYHGLLRRAAPRHSPWTLIRLTILSIHPQTCPLAIGMPQTLLLSNSPFPRIVKELIPSSSSSGGMGTRTPDL
jgi:hypothetical protein